MVKTDLRHTNNTKANRDLNTELDLWLAYVENGKQDILIGVAISPARKGIFYEKYEMFYSPSDLFKDRPFIVISEKGISHYTLRSESIKKAKYYLKRYDSHAKWQSTIKKNK